MSARSSPGTGWTPCPTAGGQGVVYRAQHLALERPAAIKIIQPQMAGTQEFRDRFGRESRTAASLEHPKILPIFDAASVNRLLVLPLNAVSLFQGIRGACVVRIVCNRPARWERWGGVGYLGVT